MSKERVDRVLEDSSILSDRGEELAGLADGDGGCALQKSLAEGV